jgi:hypothetical protein
VEPAFAFEGNDVAEAGSGELADDDDEEADGLEVPVELGVLDEAEIGISIGGDDRDEDRAGAAADEGNDQREVDAFDEEALGRLFA